MSATPGPRLARPPGSHRCTGQVRGPHARTQAGPPGRGPERGSATIFLIVFFGFALIPLVGLVFDGGEAIAARERAADLAAQAARAGAGAVSQTSLRSGSPADLRVDPATAREAVTRFLAAAGASGTVTVTGPHTVTVTARVRRHVAILPILPVASASASATTLHGTTTGRP